MDGLKWFCTEVWPGIRSSLPTATFAIVGRSPCSAVSKLAEVAGVNVIGEVPDVRPFMQRDTISIAPLQIARGIQNKVLEAMAMQQAVVASPQALEGLAVTPGVHVECCSQPDEWVDCVLELEARRERRSRLGQEARRFVEEHHSWQSSLVPLLGLLDLN